ncbi:MFS transporter [Priestia megaterium]|uniref:MFS transporter n=1 Tax=Priestia megaterium TaxID=1404 RepID=UPI0005C63BEE|nr:MFS transporter [Priestia megaterium]
MNLILTNSTLRNLVLGNLFSSVGRGMVLIGISWYLVEDNGTAAPLGITMLLSTALMILVGPYLGTYIDRFSRKRILLLENIFGFLMLTSFSVWGFAGGGYSSLILTLIYTVSMLISQVHFPTQSALVQETFESGDYNKINSMLEVQNQIAQVLAGGFAGIILLYFNLQLVLLITSGTYLIAFLMISLMKYKFTIGNLKDRKNKIWYKEFIDGIKFMKTKKGFLIFGISVFVPFIVLMVSNLLAPAFVNLELKEPVSVFSTGELAYAIGAVAAGLLVNFILKRVKRFNFLIVTISFFSLSLILMVLIMKGWAFIVIYFIMGWSVASTRLISQTIFMTIVPKQLMGRVMSSLDLLALVIRVILIATFSLSIDLIGAGVGYIILSCLLLGGALGVSISVKHLLEVNTQNNISNTKVTS